MLLYRNKLFVILFFVLLCFSTRFFPYVKEGLELPAPLSTPDPHYHARRVLVMVNQFPNLPIFDYYISFPTGGSCIWPPLFDYLAGIICYTFFFGKPDIKQVEWVCAIYPILYGILVVLLTFWIGEKLFDRRVAVFSALITTLLPSVLYWSKLGYCDHHIAESLSILLIEYFLISKPVKRVIDWIILGFIFGCGLLLWQGSILFIGVAFFVLFFNKEFLGFISLIIALLIILPFSINTNFPDSPFSYRGLSLLHVSLLGIASLIMLLGLTIKKKLGFAAGMISILLMILLFILLKDRAFIGGLFFIVKKDPWLATIIEFQSLMISSGYLEMMTTKFLYGHAYYVWPILVIILILERRSRKFYIFLTFLLFTGIMAFIGRRYSVWFAPHFAIIFSYGLFRIYQFVLEKLKTKVLAIIISLILLILSFLPLFNRNYFGSFVGPLPQELEAYKWLSDSTPQTSYFLEPDKKPEYGILCFWGDGHQILYNAKRPVAASNFGNDVPNFSIVNQFYLTESEIAANQIIEKLECRYVYVMDWMYRLRYAALYTNNDPKKYLNHYLVKTPGVPISTITTPTELGYSTTICRLFYFNGSGGYQGNKYYPPYRRYRLRFVSSYGFIKIFEYVKGGVIIGRGQTGTPVRISLDCNINGFKFTYFDSLVIKDAGVFTTVIPYPSDTVSPYIIEIGKQRHKLVVPLKVVTEGDTVQLN